MKITCQHCGIHHVPTTEEVFALERSLHEAAQKLSPGLANWDRLSRETHEFYGALTLSLLTKLAEFLPEVEPPMIDTLVKEAAYLQNFKAYVHERLDAMGVPPCPAPEDGCRIGKRLDLVAHAMHRLAGLDK